MIGWCMDENEWPLNSMAYHITHKIIYNQKDMPDSVPPRIKPTQLKKTKNEKPQ